MGWVLFYDGECGFCSCSVRWVARHDRRGRIAFAPLQGELARQHGFARFASHQDGTMVLLREADGRGFMFSDAWIELANALGGGWCLFAIFRLVPKGLRDWAYRWVSRHRYGKTGKAGRCVMPEPDAQKRLRD